MFNRIKSQKFLSAVFFQQARHKTYSPLMYGPLHSGRQEMEFLLSPEEIQVVNRFEEYRNQLDNLLKENIKTGLSRLESCDFDEAGTYFDKVIATLPVDGLTAQEKKLLAQAHTYKAKTLRIGSEASEDAALMHLELALVILPDLKEAISERDSILVDRTLPVSSPTH